MVSNLSFSLKNFVRKISTEVCSPSREVKAAAVSIKKIKQYNAKSFNHMMGNRKKYRLIIAQKVRIVVNHIPIAQILSSITLMILNMLFTNT
jgi:hypothetical protein